jgi:hypothetical protein
MTEIVSWVPVGTIIKKTTTKNASSSSSSSFWMPSMGWGMWGGPGM